MTRRLAPHVLAVLALIAAAPAARAGAPAEGTLYGSTGNVGAALITIDPATGDGTLVGAINDLGPVTEIEFRADGVLFGSTGEGASNIITIDPLTGDETLVGQHAFGAVNGLEFVGGTLYGSYFSPQPLGDGNGPPPYFLVTVDQTDGSLSTIGPIDGYFPIRGLAYDEDSATMYGIGIPLPTLGGPGGDNLFTIDLATAATTEIGPIGFFLGALEFGPDGTLYGGTDGGGQLSGGGTPDAGGWAAPGPREVVGGSAQLVTIDPATGAGTAVGPTGFPAISGLSFVPGAVVGGPSVLEIPALSWLGLALLALLLAGAGLLAVRRG